MNTERDILTRTEGMLTALLGGQQPPTQELLKLLEDISHRLLFLEVERN